MPETRRKDSNVSQPIAIRAAAASGIAVGNRVTASARIASIAQAAISKMVLTYCRICPPPHIRNSLNV
ncbi:MAG: hypothetical protein HC834_10970 [Rhodospirillales bacterium]|nr:hypothetical protein [Rhodospirillales bacterium]